MSINNRIPFGLAYDGNKHGPIHIVYDGDNVYVGGIKVINTVEEALKEENHEENSDIVCKDI